MTMRQGDACAEVWGEEGNGSRQQRETYCNWNVVEECVFSMVLEDVFACLLVLCMIWQMSEAKHDCYLRVGLRGCERRVLLRLCAQILSYAAHSFLWCMQVGETAATRTDLFFALSCSSPLSPSQRRAELSRHSEHVNLPVIRGICHFMADMGRRAA